MICYRCGTQIPDNSTFCPKCGAGQNQTINAAQYEQPTQQVQSVVPYTRKSKKSVPLAIGISCLIVVIAVVVILILLLNGNGGTVFSGGDREALLGLWITPEGNEIAAYDGYVFGKDGKLYSNNRAQSYTIYDDKKVIVLEEKSLKYMLDGSSLTLELGTSDADGSNFVSNHETITLISGRTTSSDGGVCGIWKYVVNSEYFVVNILADTATDHVIMKDKNFTYYFTDDGSRLIASEGEYVGYYYRYTVNEDSMTLRSYDSDGNYLDSITLDRVY